MIYQSLRSMRNWKSVWQNWPFQKRSVRIERNLVTADKVKNGEITWTVNKWDKPQKFFYKFNIDGGFDPKTKVGTVGGLLRNWDADIRVHFKHHLPQTISHSAISEFYALEMALRICKDKGLNMDTIIFETDSMELCHRMEKLKRDIAANQNNVVTYQMGPQTVTNQDSEITIEKLTIGSAFYGYLLLRSLEEILLSDATKVVTVPEINQDIEIDEDDEFDKETIITRIKSLISSTFQIKHVVRECNGMADVLASEAKNLPKGEKMICWPNKGNDGLGEKELKVFESEHTQKIRFNLVKKWSNISCST